MKEEVDTVSEQAVAPLDESVTPAVPEEGVRTNPSLISSASKLVVNKEDTSQNKGNTGFVWVYQEYDTSQTGLDRAIITRNKILAAHSVFPQFQTGEESEVPDFSELIQCQHPDEKAHGRKQGNDLMLAQGGHWVYPPPLSASYERGKGSGSYQRNSWEPVQTLSLRTALSRDYNPWGLVQDDEESEGSLRSSFASVGGISPVSATLTDYAYHAEENVLVNLNPSVEEETDEVTQGDSEEIDITPILVRISSILSDQISLFNESSKEEERISSISDTKEENYQTHGEKLLTPLVEVKDALKTLDRNAETPLNVRVVGDGDIVRKLITPGLADDKDVLKIGLDIVSKALDNRKSAWTDNGAPSQAKIFYDSEAIANSKDMSVEEVMNSIIQLLKADKESATGGQEKMVLDGIIKSTEKVPTLDRIDKDTRDFKQTTRTASDIVSIGSGPTQIRDKSQTQGLVGVIELSSGSTTYVGAGVDEIMHAIVEQLKTKEEVSRRTSSSELKITDEVAESGVKAFKSLKSEENGIANKTQQTEIPRETPTSSTPVRFTEEEASVASFETESGRKALKLLKKGDNGVISDEQPTESAPDTAAICTPRTAVKDSEQVISPVSATKRYGKNLKFLQNEEYDMIYKTQQTESSADTAAINSPQGSRKDLEKEAFVSDFKPSFDREKAEQDISRRSGADEDPFSTVLLRKQIDSVDQQLRAAYDSLVQSELEKHRLVNKLGRLRQLDLRTEELQALKRISEAPVPDVQDIQILDDVIKRLKKACF